MGDKRNKLRTRPRRFNLPGGMHSYKMKKNLKMAYERGVYLDTVKYKNFKGPAYQIKAVKACLSGKPRVKFVVRRILGNTKRLNSTYKFIRSNKKDTIGTFKRVEPKVMDGSRIINLDLLKEHVGTISTHSALCDKAREIALKGMSPIILVTEERHGLASVLKGKCNGCGKVFNMPTSDTLETSGGKQFTINVRGVWGSMVTGGGCSSLSESFGTMGIPSFSEGQYSKIESEIGKWWHKVLEDEMVKAGEEERALAIANNDYHDGIPAITVVCDGGWSKRSHKHTFNAMAGVGVIFGHRTKKLLHIGIRNRLCYICSQAQTKNIEPKVHECYKNWNDSAQSMESDIIVEGFLQAETKHGVRYMRLIGDGDSSTLQDIIENVPIWGKYVKKLECANHACKCLRNNLEQLVNDKPSYKGKGKLTKLARIRIVTAVRCAIKMRSDEKDKSEAIKKLKKDIKNSARHVLGIHDLCSTDFCKYKDTGKNGEHNNNNDDNIDDEIESEDIIINNENYWKDTVRDISQIEESSLRKGGKQIQPLNEEMMKDIFFYLNRLSEKSDRLIGNFTSNLAESWMHIRCKFDGGKVANKCFRGSFFARCYGGALRSLKGPAWSPMVYHQVTGIRPDSVYINTYRIRSKRHIQTVKSQNKTTNKDRKRKRKHEIQKQGVSKKARLKYGKEILDDRDDISSSDLTKEMEEYYEKVIKVTSKEIEQIENNTKDQSLNETWYSERRKRLTSSIFGDIMSRNSNNNSINLTQRLLYTKFTGNKFTRKGLNEEAITIKEYENQKKESGENCKVDRAGFMICEQNPFLGASSDGIVTCDQNVGLVEVKNLLQTETMLIKPAAVEKKNFCLTSCNNKIMLKRSHKYFYQIQGQLNIYDKEWCDFIIRRTNPYDMYVERIFRDRELWNTQMLPKLKAFYFTHILPELAVPRYKTVTGIRRAPVPWYRESKSKSKKSNTDTDHLNEQNVKKKNPTQKKILPPQLPEAQTDTNRYQINATQVDQSNISRSKRVPKVKFVGRRICHKWDKKKYSGTVLSVLSGIDGSPTALYEIHYDNDNEIYEVDKLLEEFMNGELKFLDL